LDKAIWVKVLQQFIHDGKYNVPLWLQNSESYGGGVDIGRKVCRLLAFERKHVRVQRTQRKMTSTLEEVPSSSMFR
jgi:hypothetical protein